MSRKLLLATLLGMLLLPFNVFAQATGSITGTVTDASSGETLPGATVVIVELKRGGPTNADGRFNLTNVPPGTYTLRASFLGYKDQEEKVQVGTQEAVVNLKLRLDAFGLDDVVITGYGVQPKREVTGSISQLSTRQIENIPLQSFDQAIQGRASGVQVTNVSGAPGGAVTVRIRGIGSIGAGNEPLYIIDGIQLTPGATTGQGSSNVLAGLNPNDIESIEILKDASASAIYGAQAANGVVLITTRKGKAGKTQFNATYQMGMVEQPKLYDMVNGPEWSQLIAQGAENRALELFRASAYSPITGRANFGANSIFTDASAGGNALTWAQAARLVGENYGWYAGGTANPRHRVFNGAAGYAPLGLGVGQGLDSFADAPTYDWQGAVYRTGATNMLNISASGGTNDTRFFISGSYNRDEGQVLRSEFERMSIRTNIDHQANEKLSFDLNIGLSNTSQFGAIENGNFINGPFFGAPYARPIANWQFPDGSFVPNAGGFNYNIVQGLNEEERLGNSNQVFGSLGANFLIAPGLTFRSYFGGEWRGVRDTNHRPASIPSFAGFGGSTFESFSEVINYNTSHVLNYFTTIDDVHNISGLAGFEYKARTIEAFNATGRGFPSTDFRTLNLAAVPFAIGGSYTEYRRASYFGKLKYDYTRKYIADVTVRYDGHSRFGIDNQWGLFYAVSGAYVISEEAFLRDVELIDDLKVRVGYGVTGNSEIGDFDSRTLFGSGGTYLTQAGIRPVQLGNTQLGWEEAKNLNFGIDYSLMKGRVYGSVDLFRNRNEQLLLNRNLDNTSGFGSYRQNVGVVQNQGIEVELGAVLVNAGGFRWTSEFNISFIKNEIIALNDGLENIGNTLRVGQPLGIYWLFEYAGVNPADGRIMWYDANNELTYIPVNNDNRVVGDIYPDYFGGWNNSFAFKGVTLDVFFQYSFNQMTFNQQQGFFLDGQVAREQGLLRTSLTRWQAPGDVTGVSRPYWDFALPNNASINTSSTRYTEDVSYIRLKNARLSYAVPTGIAQAANLRNLSVFVQGQNLLTWTGYTGLDPELVATQTAVYPQARIVTAGINLQF